MVSINPTARRQWTLRAHLERQAPVAPGADGRGTEREPGLEKFSVLCAVAWFTEACKYQLAKTCGARRAPAVKRPTLDFCLGHGLRVVGLSPALGSMSSLLGILCLSLPLPLPCSHEINKMFFKKLTDEK